MYVDTEHPEDNIGPKVNFDIYRMPNPIKPESIPKFRHDTNSVFSMGLKYFNKLEKKALINFPNPDYFNLNHKKLQKRLSESKQFSDVYAQRVLLNKNTKKNYVSLDKPFPLINKISSSQALNKTNEFLFSVIKSPMTSKVKKNLEKLYKIRLLKENKLRNFETGKEYNVMDSIAKNMTFTLKDEDRNIGLDLGNFADNEKNQNDLIFLKKDCQGSKAGKNDFFLVNSNFGRRKSVRAKVIPTIIKTEEQIKAEKEKEELDKIENDIINSFKYQKYKTFQNEDKTLIKSDDIIKQNTLKSEIIYDNEKLITLNNGTKEYFFNHSCFSQLKSNFLTQINFKKVSKEKERVEIQLENEQIKQIIVDNSLKKTLTSNYNTYSDEIIRTTSSKINEEADKKSSVVSEVENKVKSKLIKNLEEIKSNKKVKKNEMISNSKNPKENISKITLKSSEKKSFDNGSITNKYNEDKLIKSKINNIYDKEIKNQFDLVNFNQSSSSIYINNSTDHNEFLPFYENSRIKKRELKENYEGNSTINFTKSPKKKNEEFKIYHDLIDNLDINNKKNYNCELNTKRNQPKTFVPDFEKYKLRTFKRDDGFLDKMKNLINKHNKSKEIKSKSKNERVETLQNDINILEEIKQMNNLNFKTQSSFIPLMQKSSSHSFLKFK